MKKGFTLIELVVVTGLLGLVVVTVTGVFLNSMKATAKMELDQRLDESGNLVVERLSRSIMSMGLVEDYDSVCLTGIALNSITLVNRDGDSSVLTCVDERISLGSESISPADLRVDCTDGFSIYCDANDRVPAIEVNFTVSSKTGGGTYGEGAEVEKSFSTKVMMRGY